jgi:hypothetical protein
MTSIEDELLEKLNKFRGITLTDKILEDVKETLTDIVVESFTGPIEVNIMIDNSGSVITGTSRIIYED